MADSHHLLSAFRCATGRHLGDVQPCSWQLHATFKFYFSATLKILTGFSYRCSQFLAEIIFSFECDERAC